MKSLEKYDFIISLGEMFLDSKLEISDEANFIYMHPIDNEKLKNSYSRYIKYEAGSEEGVIALLLNFFTKNQNEELNTFLDELDIGYISAESNAGEEEFEEIFEESLSKTKKAIFVADEIFTNENSVNIKAMLKALKEFSDFEIIVNDNIDLNSDDSLDEVAEISAYDGTVLYTFLNSVEAGVVIGGVSFSRAAKVVDGDDIEIIYNGTTIKAKFSLDENLKGTIALYGSKNMNLLNEGYPYKQVRIKKVG